MRGSVSGVVWGLVLGGAGLSIASLVGEQPIGDVVPDIPQLVVSQTAQTEPAPQGLTGEPPENLRDFAATAPQVTPPTAVTAEPVPDTEPAVAPQTVEIETGLRAPDTVMESDVATMREEPVLPTALSAAPQVPAVEQEVIVTTQAVPSAPEVPALPVTPAPGQPAPASAADVPIAEADLVQQGPSAPQEMPVGQSADDDQAAPASEDVDTAPTTTMADPQDVPLPEATTGVRVNRLGVDGSDSAGTEAEVTLAPAMPDDAPALWKFAAAFENPQGWPMVSIVLIDAGGVPDPVAAVSSLPFSPTVILDALEDGADALMRAYRDAGIEVGMQTPLPPGATPRDVEVIFEAAFKTIPEAAVFFSDSGDSLHADRAVTAQAMQVLAADGLGLIVQQRGLGNALRAAEQAAVPAGLVQRDLTDEDIGGMRRALDQAVLRARQDSGVFLLARITPQTLAVLADWASEAAANEIAVAPASAVLGAR